MNKTIELRGVEVNINRLGKDKELDDLLTTYFTLEKLAYEHDVVKRGYKRQDRILNVMDEIIIEIEEKTTFYCVDCGRSYIKQEVKQVGDVCGNCYETEM